MNFPFFMLVVGPSQTGKTTWILNFIKHFSFINPGHTLQNVLFLHMAEFNNLPDMDYGNINFHSVKSNMSENESKVDEEIIATIEKFKKKVETPENEDDDDEHKHNLIIMDDMMLAVGSRRKMMHYVEELVTRKCHHENINYIFVIQDLMFSSSKFRMLFSNANYILFPNKSDRNVKHILRLRGYNVKEIAELLKQAFNSEEKAHPYLLLDSTVKFFENVRIRQGIFPNENLYVFNKLAE